MATLGFIDTPGDNYFFDDFGNTEWWTGQLVMPAGGGIVTDVYVYVGGDGASVTGQLVIWGNGPILWQSGNITFPAGTRAVRGQGWIHQSVPSVYVAAGILQIGWWSSGNVVWTMSPTGATYYLRSQSSPGAISGFTSEGGGNPGAYLVYTPGGIMRVRRGGAWTVAQVQVRRGGVWTTPQGVYVRRGGVWVPAS